MADCLMSKSNTFKTKVQNALLRGQDLVAPSSVYIALYVSDPTGANTGQEVDGGGYERQLVTFGNPTINGDVSYTSNTDDISFAVATSDWGLISHIGLHDSATGGELIMHGALANPRTIIEGDLIRFFSGKIEVEEG